MSEKESSHDTSGSSTPSLYYGAAYVDQPQSAPILVQNKADRNTTVITVESRANQDAVPYYDNCHLVWSVVSLFCCSVFGMIATVMAILGYADHRTGNHADYRRKRRCAVGFLVTAIICGICMIAVYTAYIYIQSTAEGDVADINSSMDSDSFEYHD